MSPVKAIIAEDEAHLREYIKKSILALWPDLDICGEARNGYDALELAERYEPHIAFLDIKMPGLSGIEVARKISDRCHVVFITAYDHYAIEAFEAEAIDYLVKPLATERLQKTITRLQKTVADTAAPADGYQQVIKGLAEIWSGGKPTDYLQWIKAQHGEEIQLIPVNSICYFMASEKYTVVKTNTSESLIRKTIKELSDELDPGTFWRIHRSTIVNVNAIDTVNRSFNGKLVLTLKEIPDTLTVSRSFSHLFKQM